MTSGTLYLCATPIGNLEDMTYRAARILKEVDVIAAEDTRHTRKLLAHFDIHTPMVSYHEHNKETRGPELIDQLRDGRHVAVVSDAGLPGISDPGAHLAALAVAAGVPVTALPGANAALTALICSGLPTACFTFVGFLPRTAAKRRELLRALAVRPDTLIFYESPYRLRNTLAELAAAFGDRPAAAGRELTKKFEEFVRGDLGELTAHFAQTPPRGEFTLVVGGAPPAAAPPAIPTVAPPAAVRALLAGGMDKKTAVRTVAAERGLPKREVYNAFLADEKKKQATPAAE